jgi:phosphopantetheinyl transferase (holo-ACP synthase)
MLGNDVVDLADVESRVEAHHPRFDARVFDESERALIAAGPPGEIRRWTLWAAKESAYKAARKENASTLFEPRRFVVRVAGDGRLVVTAVARRFRVDVRGDADHIHAVAHRVDDPLDPLCVAVAMLPAAGDDERAAVRRLAAVTIARRLGLAMDDVVVARDGRIPALWIRGRRAAADLSLSHHGRFVAVACMIPGQLP